MGLLGHMLSLLAYVQLLLTITPRSFSSRQFTSTLPSACSIAWGCCDPSASSSTLCPKGSLKGVRTHSLALLGIWLPKCSSAFNRWLANQTQLAEHLMHILAQCHHSSLFLKGRKASTSNFEDLWHTHCCSPLRTSSFACGT